MWRRHVVHTGTMTVDNDDEQTIARFVLRARRIGAQAVAQC